MPTRISLEGLNLLPVVRSAIEIPVDIRLICATSQNLHQMVNERRFREDLLYRINMVEIHVPSLQERKDEKIWYIERPIILI